jgi:D-glycero-D-manno-heptose 1,7-bisphosphate phosphatase
MLTDLMANWPVDVGRSLLIGDQLTDLSAAAAAGISAHQFTGGNLHDFILPLVTAAGSPALKDAPHV